MATKKSIRYTKKIPTSIDYRRMSMLEREQRNPASVRAAKIRAAARADFQEREDVLDYRVREDQARIAREQASFMRQRGSAMAADREEVRRKAQFDAAHFEYRYTAKQKLTISRIRSAQNVFSNDPRNSKDDIANANTRADEIIMHIKPSWLPRLSPYPENKGVGDIWDEQGVMTSRKQNGETWQIDTAKTVGGQAQLAKFKLDQARLSAQQKREGKLFDLRIKLLTTDVAGAGGMKRPRTAEEVNKIMELLSAPRERRVSAGRKQPAESYREIGNNRMMPPLTPNDPEYGGASHISSDADYEKLPPGAKFIGPDDVLRRKPGGEE